LDELRALVTPRTRLILICNPNNPTGACLPAEELAGICAIASTQGAWVLSDEIYRGAELRGPETASVYGRYERAIVTSGLSKAYGLPGLRIGWIVGPPSLVATLWSYHDYTTIAPGALSDRLARSALASPRRASLLERTRRIIRTNYPVVREWLEAHGDVFSHIAPEAGAIVYVRYRHPINSLELVTHLRERKSVLIVPGDHFDMDGYLRIGFGSETTYLREGLGRLHDLLGSLSADAAR
ncbi:MAG: aminotransferase class I/II-fold pyridoxal phosphate-dependent enzyme, partial [Acidobacteria bacterium]|nr:aminotransferase class I/II-fold pyridoxal phosphate-dependent enzyme [Acidobacteriota bacterium]